MLRLVLPIGCMLLGCNGPAASGGPVHEDPPAATPLTVDQSLALAQSMLGLAVDGGRT